MIMNNIKDCLVCGNKHASYRSDAVSSAYIMECPICGRYILHGASSLKRYEKNSEIKQKIKLYLFYHKNENYKFIGTDDEFEDIRLCGSREIENLKVKHITLEQIHNWYPKNFAEKTDKILIYLAQRGNYDGECIKLSKKEATLLFFMHNDPCFSNDWNFEFKYYLNFFVKNGYFDGFEGIDLLDYIDIIDDTKYPIDITLSPKALERVYELQKIQANNKKVFVAMSFHESADGIRNAIKAGIKIAGYSAELMDEIVHNHQIVPEMLRLITESRFLIMDITQPNLGAYYESGYAQGLGKEVIITCREDIFNQKEFLCEENSGENKKCWHKEVSTKPHFDIAQKQILVWKDFDDLTHKLSEWIKYIIG